MNTLHKVLPPVVLSVFGSHPCQIQIYKSKSNPVVTIKYQDFLTPKTLTSLLSRQVCFPVEWDLHRTMSDDLRHRLLDELFSHPEQLSVNPVFRNNPRLYVLDRFVTTDFDNENIK